MKGLQYSTHDVFDGPWMLNAKALKDLDLIISKYWTLLENRRIHQLDIATDDESQRLAKQKEISSRYVAEQIEVFRRNHPIYSVHYLQFRTQYKKSTYFSENFESAIRARELEEAVPEGFAIEFHCGDINGRIDLEKTNGLTINISPEEIQETQDMYHEVSQWANDHQAPYWQRLWGNIANYGFAPYLVMSFLLGVIFVFINLMKNNSDIKTAQIAASQLLDQGLTESNLLEAVKLLLQMQVLGKPTIEFPGWFRGIVLVAILLGIILPIRPKAILGIGKGSERLRYWKIWQGIVGITIPTIILYNLVIPYVLDLFKQLVISP